MNNPLTHYAVLAAFSLLLHASAASAAFQTSGNALSEPRQDARPPVVDSQVAPAAAVETDRGVTAASDETIMYWQVGVTVTPRTWPVRSGIVRIPIPVDWPEQKVILYSEGTGTGLSYVEKNLPSGIRFLEVDIPSIDKGDKAELLLTYQVALTALPKPTQTEYFKRPEAIDKSLAPHLRSTAQIELKSSALKKLVDELMQDRSCDWDGVERMYDWVLKNIELSADKSKGAAKTLEAKKGNREDRVNLFVAMCRAAKIPARPVWGNNSEYAEFYLLDDAGEGRWLACQLSGPREFGSLTHPGVVEQKGEEYDFPGAKSKHPFANITASIQTVRNTRSEKESAAVQFIRRPLTQPPPSDEPVEKQN